MVYITINKEFFEETKTEAEKEANLELGEEGVKTYLWQTLPDETVIDEIENGKILAHIDSKLGYISFVINLDDDDFVCIIEQAIKKMNKLKSVLESLK